MSSDSASLQKSQPQLFLLKGLGQSHLQWGRVLTVLQELYRPEQLNFLDISGNGTEHLEKTPLCFKEALLRLRIRFLEQKKTSAPIYLVACSLGGMLGHEWMRLYPNDFTGAILINTSFRSLSPFYHRLKPSCLLKMVKVVLAPNNPTAQNDFINMISNKQQEQPLNIKNWKQAWAKYPVSRLNLLKQLVLALRMPEQKSLDQKKILLLCSKKDQMVHPKCSQTIHETFGYPLIFNPQAGHDISLDDPQWLVNQIHSWIQS